MRTLTLKLVLPLTIISFILFTRWTYAIIIDGTDEFLYGFPFIYTCRGFHTSLSIQFFIVEFFADLLCYFIFWYVLVYLVNRFLFSIKVNKFLLIALVVSSILLSFFMIEMLTVMEKNFSITRPFEIEIIDYGYKFLWEDLKRK